MAQHALTAPTPSSFSRTTRDARLGQLDDTSFDLLVIGAGITGAGIARDAAMRGLRVAMVDKGDLASGTSSASSKLVHGGLRYLEHRQFGLVFESVSERARLGELAPHLVRPLPFFFPVYRKRPRPVWQIALGLSIYEALALYRVPKRHQTLRGARAREAFPTMNPDGFDGGVVFWDCATDDARLTLATARAAHDAGAWVLPYTEVVEFVVHRARVGGAVVRDRFTGATHTLSARVVVNATGPWTDRTLGLRRQRSRLLRPTKGVHIVLPADRLPLGATITVPREDEHFVFAIPSGERVLVGTTDTDYDGDYDSVQATAGEVRSLLAALNGAFPGAHLGPQDVVGSWGGLRPLISPHGDHVDPMAVSREHHLVEDEDGLITIAGGKLTTYRLMSAEVVDRVAKRLREDGMHVGRCPTAAVRLPGGDGIRWEGDALVTTGPGGRDADAELVERYGADTARHLRQAHGGRWLDVVGRAAREPALGERIVPDLPYLWAEIDHAVHEELAVTLEDMLRRRTQIQIRARDQGASVAEAVAERMGGLLGWSDADRQAQLDHWAGCVAAQESWRADWSDADEHDGQQEADG